MNSKIITVVCKRRVTLPSMHLHVSINKDTPSCVLMSPITLWFITRWCHVFHLSISSRGKLIRGKIPICWWSEMGTSPKKTLSPTSFLVATEFTQVPWTSSSPLDLTSPISKRLSKLAVNLHLAYHSDDEMILRLHLHETPTFAVLSLFCILLLFLWNPWPHLPYLAVRWLRYDLLSRFSILYL